ncbi:uncharacterized protein [Bombus flavifrons]|uniref:uncharacterized protein isoform X2 n=1 Tax=Bombus flavifrons TaxID=103934 RepID=UPI00370481EC
MNMWFWFGNNLGNFLLPKYNVITTSSFFCTCLGLFALAILYEVCSGLRGVFKYFIGLGYWIFGLKLIELNVERFFEKRTLLDCDKECADNIVHCQGDELTVPVIAEQFVTEATVEVHMPEDA